MSVVIGEVQTEVVPDPGAPASAAAGPARPVVEEVRLALRRDEDRRRRLWVD